MKRILRASFSISGNAADEVVSATIDQGDLDAAVPQGGGITPLALIFDPEDADITVKSLISKNAKNSENQKNILPSGTTGISLTALNKVTVPEAGGVETSFYPTSLGFALEGIFDNADSGIKVIECLIVVENDLFTQPRGLAKDDAAGLAFGIPNATSRLAPANPSFARLNVLGGGGMKDNKNKEAGGG